MTPTCLDTFFHLEIAQRGPHVSPHARQDNVFRKVGAFELTITAFVLLAHATTEWRH